MRSPLRQFEKHREEQLVCNTNEVNALGVPSLDDTLTSQYRTRWLEWFKVSESSLKASKGHHQCLLAMMNTAERSSSSVVLLEEAPYTPGITSLSQYIKKNARPRTMWMRTKSFRHCREHVEQYIKKDIIVTRKS